MIRLAIFASGSGTNFEHIVTQLNSRTDISVTLLLCNKPQARVLERARRLNVESRLFTRDEFLDGTRIVDCLASHHIDGIVLAGFMLRIADNIVDAYEGRILNIHPSLIPKHCGMGMYGHHVHQAVIDDGDSETGITIHEVNHDIDCGRIVFQATCPVMPDDDADTLAARVHQLEYAHYPNIICRHFLHTT